MYPKSPRLVFCFKLSIEAFVISVNKSFYFTQIYFTQKNTALTLVSIAAVYKNLLQLFILYTNVKGCLLYCRFNGGSNVV